MADGAGFETIFRQATGREPHGYQRRVAEGAALPALIEVPPGFGKTAAIVLAWLWRRLYHPDPSIRGRTPRRLVYALPQRALVDQVAREISRWLAGLSLEAEVALHVIMGGRGSAAKSWRSAPEAVSILVGTVDMIASKALVRAYGAPRNIFPLDAALVWNDAHLVVDEVQLAAASTTTLRQIDAFRSGWTAAPSGLTCMSATVPRELIDTVDNPYPAPSTIVRLGADDDTEDLARRRAAIRTIRQASVRRGDSKEVAELVVERHRTGGLTLAIANTVKSAREIDKAVRRLAPAADVVLLHSQFRPVDRVGKIETLFTEPPPAGRVVVSTQVVEAGIDIDAVVLITETAPWSSLVQRSGRCNRRGLTDDAELWWYESARPAPYTQDELDETARALAVLEGAAVTAESLLQTAVTTKPLNPLMLRRPDFEALFDTAPDLSGHDLDIAPYIRDTDDLSVQICWMAWDENRPPDELRLLDPDYRCRVPVGDVAALIKTGKPVWRKSPLDSRWHPVDARSPARPGEILLVPSTAGGYDETIGFAPTSGKNVRVPESPAAESAADGDGDAGSLDPRSFGSAWVSLDQHLDETGSAAVDLLSKLTVPPDQAADVLLAARVHDVGKAHPLWQDALCATAGDEERQAVESGRPWAKSADSRRRLRYTGGVRMFRHELASLLLLDGPLAARLDDANDPDLVRYLVLSHHGKLRVQVRDPLPSNDGRFLGFRDGDTVEVCGVLGQPTAALQTTLARFRLGGHLGPALEAWADVVAELIERYGIYRLAYLETLVRIADWRASALHDRDEAGL